MSADADPARPPEPESGNSVREKLPILQAKRRYKRVYEPDPGDGDSPAARRDQRGGEESSAPASADQIADEIETLNARLRALTAQRDGEQRPPVNGSRGAKYFRLARKQIPLTVPRDPATAAAAPDPASGEAPASTTAGPVTLPTPPAIHYAPGQDAGWHPGWLLASVGIVVLGLGAFFLGRVSNRPLVIKEIAPTLAATWSAADIGQLDKIIATDRSGDLDGAFHQVNRLSKSLGPREGLTLYSAALQARAGGVNNAEADLVRSVSAYGSPLVIAALQDRLGFVCSRRRDFNSASDCFAAVVTYNPFDPAAFYHWGESLRRSGKLVDAIDKFQAALLRLPPESLETNSLRECAALRLRLTQIELGNDADVKTALDQRLRQPVPSVYWLLTAVAYDLQHNDPADAVAAAERAKVVAPPAEFDLLFNDYFLRSLAARTPGLVAYVPELTPARLARLDASLTYFIDP